MSIKVETTSPPTLSHPVPFISKGTYSPSPAIATRRSMRRQQQQPAAQRASISRDGRPLLNLEQESTASSHDPDVTMDVATARPDQSGASGWPQQHEEHNIATSFDDAFRHDGASSGMPSPVAHRSGSISSTVSHREGSGHYAQRQHTPASYSESSVSHYALSPEGPPSISSPDSTASGIPMAASSQAKRASSSMSSLFGTSVESIESLRSSVMDSPSPPPTTATKGKGKAPKKPRAPRKEKSGSHAKAKASGHIPRPRNAFILFRSHAVKSGIVTNQDEKDHRNISRIVSHMWNSLSETDRSTWQAEAQNEKEEHARLYPEYKYQPQVRSTSKARRNVSRPDDVLDKCAKIADDILKKNGEDGIKTDANGEILSASAKFKRDRREAHAVKVATRKARALTRPSRSRTTSKNSQIGFDGGSPYLTSSSPYSVASGFSSYSASPSPASFYSLPAFPVVQGRRGSAAGDLATSISTRDGIGARTMPMPLDGPQLSLSRRGSSVPPLDDTNAGPQGFKMAPHPMFSGEQGAKGYGQQADVWSRPEKSLFRGWSGVDGELAPQGPQSVPMEASSSARKAPPPAFDLGGHSNLKKGFLGQQHLQDIGGDMMSPRTLASGQPLPPSDSPWSTNAKAKEGAPTPRASNFQHALRPWSSHATNNDFTLLSPLKSNFGGAPSGRRTSAAWSNWNRMSNNFGAEPGQSPSGGRRISILGSGAAFGSSLPSNAQQEAMALSLFSPTTTAFTQLAGRDSISGAAPGGTVFPAATGPDGSLAVDENVFQFSPEFLLDLESNSGGDAAGRRRISGNAAGQPRESGLVGIEADREAAWQQDAFGRRVSQRLVQRWMQQQQPAGPPEEEVAVFPPHLTQVSPSAGRGDAPESSLSRQTRRRSSQQRITTPPPPPLPQHARRAGTSGPSSPQHVRSPTSPRKPKKKASSSSTPAEGVVQRSVPLSPAPRSAPRSGM